MIGRPAPQPRKSPLRTVTGSASMVAHSALHPGWQLRAFSGLGRDRLAAMVPSKPSVLRLRMLPDPHVLNLHRGRRIGTTLSRVVKDQEHRRGSNPGGHASDIDAVIVIGDDSGLPVRGKGMPAARIVPAGAAASAADAYTLRICRAMEGARTPGRRCPRRCRSHRLRASSGHRPTRQASWPPRPGYPAPRATTPAPRPDHT